MDNSGIYLSPNECLGYLVDIERKIPIAPPREYKPLALSYNIFNERYLVEEATNMLKHAGLSGFTTRVTYSDLPVNTAGRTNTNQALRGVIDIEVSRSHKEDRDILLAILAHEVCHHIIALNGITPPIATMTETYCDLATIYMGFGGIIINGYRKNGHCLGYLTLNTYKLTRAIVDIIRHRRDTIPPDIDPLAEDALRKWCEYQGEDYMKKVFVESAKSLYSKQRLLSLFEVLFDEIKKDVRDKYIRLELALSESPIEMRPLAAFRLAYKMSIEEDNGNESPIIRSLQRAFIDITGAVGKHDMTDFALFPVCPYCGNKSENRPPGEGVYIVRCKSCSQRFAYDGSKLNFTIMQRESKSEVVRLKEELEAMQLKSNRVNRKKTKIWWPLRLFSWITRK